MCTTIENSCCTNFGNILRWRGTQRRKRGDLSKWRRKMERWMNEERGRNKMEGCGPNLEGDGDVRVRPKGRLREDTEWVRTWWMIDSKTNGSDWLYEVGCKNNTFLKCIDSCIYRRVLITNTWITISVWGKKKKIWTIKKIFWWKKHFQRPKQKNKFCIFFFSLRRIKSKRFGWFMLRETKILLKILQKRYATYNYATYKILHIISLFKYEMRRLLLRDSPC